MKINLILFFMFMAISASAQVDVIKLFYEADSLYREHQYRDALKLYDRILVIEPNKSLYNSYKGLCHFKLQEYEKAKESFRLAVLYSDGKDKESLALDYSNLSAAYSELLNINKAYEYALKAYYMDETDQTLFNAASNANNAGDYKKVIELIDKSKIEKQNGFNTLYARAYFSLYDYEKCIEYYETFFQNYDKNEEYTKVLHMSDESLILLKAYLFLIKKNIENDINTKVDEPRIVELADEVSRTDKNESLKESFFYVINNDKGNVVLYSEVLTDVFNTIQNTTPLENAILLYRVKDFEKSQKIIISISIDNDMSSDIVDQVKLYKYLNELNFMLIQIDKNSETVDEKQLNNVTDLFYDYYKNKKVADYDAYLNEEEYSNPINETLKVINKDSEYKLKIIQLILTRIFEKIPNEKVSKQGIEFLNKLNKK